MADINPILAAASRASAAIDTGTAGIVTARTSQSQLEDASASIQTDIGLNNNIIESQKNLAALNTQRARQKIGAVTGTDMSLQGEQMTGLVNAMNEAYETKTAALKDIQSKDSVSFFDNPFEFITNQFSINDDIRKHNAASAIVDSTKQHIDQLNQVADEVSKNQSNFTDTLTQSAIDAASKNNFNLAALAANKARIEGLGYNVEALQVSMRAPIEQLQIKQQVLGAQMSLQRLGLEAANFDLHKQEFDWKKEQVQNAKETDEFFIDRIQKGLQVMYGDKAPNLTASPKLAKQYLGMLKMGGEPGQEAKTAYMAGQTGMLGGSPATVIDSLKQGVAFQFTPAQEGIKKIFDISTQGLANDPTVTKENYRDKLNSSVLSKIQLMQKDIEPGAENLFNIGSVSQLIKMPGVIDTSLAQKVLAPAIASGAKLDDPKQVVATALSAVSSGTIKLSDAVDGIVALYTKGTHTNMDTRQLIKFGIVPPTDPFTYKTKIQTNPFAIFGGTEIVDLTDRNAVQRAIMKSMSSVLTNNNDITGWNTQQYLNRK